MDLKKPLTFDEQLDKLVAHGMTITDREKAKDIKNNSLFAYTLVLLKRLPDEESKKSLMQTVEKVIDDYRNDIDLELICFPENYLEIMKNNL